MLAVFIIAALCVVIDQVTKLIVVGNIPLGESVTLIPGVFRFTYIRNEGAAFGSLSGARWVFMVASVLLIIALIAYTVYKRPRGALLCTALGFVIGGGIGNMIDRVALGFVVDFLDFCAFPNLWQWIFNGADSFVVVGAVLLIIAFIRDDNILTLKKKPAGDGDTSSYNDDEKGGTDDETV